MAPAPTVIPPLPVVVRLRLPVPVTAPEIVVSVLELFVQVCAAPMTTGALMVSAPAPLLTVMPLAELVGVMVRVPPVPGAMLTALLSEPPSKVRLLMVNWPPLSEVVRLAKVALVV